MSPTPNSTTSRSHQTRSSPSAARSPARETDEKHENGAMPAGGRMRMHIPMPGVNLNVPMPRADLSAVEGKRLAWWGSLAVLAALDVLEWPVAAVVAVGSYIAENQAKDATKLRRETDGAQA
jgi:hypothetical protein